jgi:hypothetical protein
MYFPVSYGDPFLKDVYNAKRLHSSFNDVPLDEFEADVLRCSCTGGKDFSGAFHTYSCQCGCQPAFGDSFLQCEIASVASLAEGSRESREVLDRWLPPVLPRGNTGTEFGLWLAQTHSHANSHYFTLFHSRSQHQMPSIVPLAGKEH